MSARLMTDDLNFKPNANYQEKTRSVTSFYYQSAINAAAEKASIL